MGWTSLFLNTDGKKVFILGTGEVAHRRANKFLDNGAEIILVGNKISKELVDKGAQLEKDISNENIKKLVDWSDIVVIASGNHELNEYVSSISSEKLINRADYPKKGNLIVPTSFYVDDVQISIFTNGKSPLMARELRKKIQNLITNEDLLQIKLQDYARNILKEKFDNQKERKEYLYKILKNNDIKNLLKEEKLEDAKKLAENIINKEDSY
ncbi:bifunctional precorrin-2 dehydrogenase/sirohydrochlorin ferrochelatase [Methanobrevibacter sp. TMH8]|uniref:precorrin-2 dehydrogenase/sirohydrochlorin ferrochelatase family protein n=1 Tax=Methanobrevibacter sp. TMH8 TaxID=2848611 RepID=UPI001CCB695C|nr:bifunctional precorrin-2 dehydrogenase/sirohydrochlorin ferrochelatase [Methanobrevibacter sp. TMH8]MBZ9571210.1 bifunctional precorrin-2 dehydrogenase/sirohydrochlorin ferrochelatase [Methanobrevibacter sp. TMH8]